MTALVTGASSGIGKVFAERLARDGHNLIVVARRKSRLDALATSIQNAYGVSVEVVVADLAKRNDIERVAGIIERAENLDFLINNAGFGTSELFIEAEPVMQIAMLDVHVMATMRLTQAAMPGMIARSRGSVINVSSVAAFMYGSNRANYCASKAYINVFTKSVQEEVRQYGLKLQALCPGFTYSEFHDTDEFEKFSRTTVPSFMWMRAEEVVDSSLRALKKRRTIFIPGIQNRLIVGALKVPPLRWMMMQRVRSAERRRQEA